MSVLERRKVLVLNKNWQPISAITLRDALTKLFPETGAPKARIIEPESYSVMTWDDWSKLRPTMDEEVLRSGNVMFRIPEIILLSNYDKQPMKEVHFSRRNLYIRDNLTCQYCGKQPGTEDLSIDHVIPKSKGGKSTWDNCVIACTDCNFRKADKTLKAANMKLLKTPEKPKLAMFRIDGRVKPVKSWKQFIDLSYWSVGIDET